MNSKKVCAVLKMPVLEVFGAPAELGADPEAGIDLLTGPRVARPVIDLLDSLDLRRGEAGAGSGPLCIRGCWA